MNSDKRSYVVEKIIQVQVSVLCEIVPQNNRRIALMFACLNNSIVSTVPGLLTSGQGGSFPIMGTTGVLAEAVINKTLHGALATCAWYAINTAGNDSFQVIEVLEAD